MKMFQVQFHTGFVPRNATTVKFAKYVSVTRGRGREGWSAQMPTNVTRGWGQEVWRAQISTTVTRGRGRGCGVLRLPVNGYPCVRFDVSPGSSQN